MAHELEITNDGKYPMVYVGDVPWHKHDLGLLKPPATVEEAASYCHAADPVKAVDMTADLLIDGKIVTIPCDDRKMIVRMTDHKFIASVGYDYEVIQALDIFKQAQPAIDAGFLTIETMGTLREGARPWMQCRITKTEADIVANDQINAFITFFLSHDGSLAAGSMDNAIRVVCQNTLNIALGEAFGRAIKIRHTKNGPKMIGNIGEAIEAKRASYYKSVEALRGLARVQVNSEKLNAYIADVFAPELATRFSTKNEEKQAENVQKAETATNNLLAEIVPLFEKGRGNDLPGVAGTAWGALNAVTEYLTHERGRTVDTRLDALWFGRSAQTSQRAFSLALKLAA